MQRVLVAAVILVLCCTGCVTVQERPTDVRLSEAQKAYDEGKRLKDAGQYTEAVPHIERALELRKAVIGSNHLEVASCLGLLGEVQQIQGNYVHAEPLHERALAIRERALGKDHPQVATTLNSLATLYQAQGQYGRAKPLLVRALAIREGALGKDHPDVATSLNSLANFYTVQGQYGRAEPLYERALAINEGVLGKNHPEVARLLNNLANLYRIQGQNERAEPLLERALTIWEGALGKDHPDVATALNSLANIYGSQGQYGRVGPLLERALAIREGALGKDHPRVATTLNSLANLYHLQGQTERAELLFARALAIRERALGKDHPDVAISLDELANLYRIQGQYRRAEPLLERALTIWEGALGKDHPDVATSLNILANLYHVQGQYRRAELLLERALAIRERALGKDHPQVATSLNNLANLYHVQGQYGRAEPLLERALTIRERALGKEHLEVANSLNSLASFYKAQGQYGRAEPLYERALAIREGVLGKNHPDVAKLLNNLANLYQEQEQNGRAEPLFERALAIREGALGKEHPDVATSLNNLANLYQDQGQYRRAEPLLARALAIWEGALGKDHPDVAISLVNLANLSRAQGQYGRAAPLYERALAIWERTLGKDHPDVSRLLNNLALLRFAQHHLAESLLLFERALTRSEQHLRQEVFGFSEARLASVLHLLRADEEILYALVRAHPDQARVRRLALTAALLRKSRSTEEIAATSRIIYRGLGPEDKETFERLRALRTQRSTLSLAGPGQLSYADYQQRLKELADQGDALEAELARNSASLRALHALPPTTELTERVAATLPRDGSLVEFVAYNDVPLVPKPGTSASQRPGEPRYLALLLFADGRTGAVDLGPAAPINSAALHLRDALANGKKAYQHDAQAFYELVFRPLVPQLGKTRRLFLSPDGQLGLVPFEALHDGRRFLIDAFDMTYLTSGKDLLRRPEDRSAARSVVVLADPDFGAIPTASPLSMEGSPAIAERSASLERFFSALRSELPDKPWQRLFETRKEADAIKRLFPDAHLLLEREATKEALLKLETPGLLHIATHGFFLEDDAAPAATRIGDAYSLVAARNVGSIGAIADTGPNRSPDPLLRSGLVLAGGSVSSGSYRREDSVVTALELAGLDLWGTQLVVLSACETGQGDVKQVGQGVYGLRRALVVAGAETVVASLWRVNDETARELMESYYGNLRAGQGRAEALREAMKALRQKKPHPQSWAAFIAIGQDAPLRGLAPQSMQPPAP